MATVLHSSGLNAHERLKSSFWTYVSAGITVSAVAHFLVLANVRVAITDDYAIHGTGELEQVELMPPEIEIPPPPQAISRPAVPVIATRLDIPEDITIAEIVFSDIPVESPPPPPRQQDVTTSDSPTFTPFEVRPRLLNGTELQRLLLARYPQMLKNAGIGGETLLWIYIDANGQVMNTEVVATSGYQELDEVAQEVMRDGAKFSPALNRDIRVPVWIQMPVAFEARMAGG